MSLNELLEENQRLRKVGTVGNNATIYVAAIVALCVLSAGFVVLISVARPNADNTGLILAVLGIVAPVITALLAAAIQQVHVGVNSRLTQLLELTAVASKAEGKLSVMSPATRPAPAPPSDNGSHE